MGRIKRIENNQDNELKIKLLCLPNFSVKILVIFAESYLYDMKITLFNILMFFFVAVANGQITITNAAFPKVGDTLRFSIDNLPMGLELGEPGPSKIWDFRKLQAPNTVEQVLRPVNESDYGARYPNAGWFYKAQGDAEFFYRKTSAAVLQMGFAGGINFGANNFQVIARNEPNLVERTAPMRYEDTFNSASSQFIPFSAAFIPDTLLAGLPIRPDSVRFNIRITQNSTVDAWGTMQIPMGTFDVLRERRVVISNRGLEVKSNALPIWLPIPGDILPFPGLTGIDTSVVYYFWNDKSPEPIAVAQTRGQDEQLVSVQFKSDPISTSVYTPPTNRSYDIIAYPNPAIGSVRFDMNGLNDGFYRLRIFNLLGQEVWSKRYQITGGKKTVRLELGNFEKGTYLYSLTDDRGKTLVTKRLVVLMP